MKLPCSVLVLVLLTLILVTACETTDPPLELHGVEPSQIPTDRSSGIIVQGVFYSPLGADLGNGQLYARDEYQVELSGIQLTDILLLSEHEIQATVPFGFPVGWHNLLVRDVLGREANLEKAVEVYPQDWTRPRVEVISPQPGDRFRPNDSVYITFSITDEPPGKVVSYRWELYGAATGVEERTLSEPVSRYYGAVPLVIPSVTEQNMLSVIISAYDDAAEPNEGSDLVQLLIDVCATDEDCEPSRAFCDRRERCVYGECVVVGDQDCDDSIACTVDQCETGSDVCSHIPNDAFCDDLVYCNGEETCHSELGCIRGYPPCDDGIECTIDLCTENAIEGELGECIFVYDHDFCDDGLFCNGIERCEYGYGCKDGLDPCRDMLNCMTRTCDEDRDVCGEVILDHSLCDDGLSCTQDVCDAYEGCTNIPGDEGISFPGTCTDGIDNDCDFEIDGDDTDCFSAP